MNTTELTPVESSNIAAAGYDADALTLRVRFTSGDEYVYIGVTEDVGQAFFEAESVGRYFNANIRHAYTFEKIDLDAIQSEGYSFQIEMHYRTWKQGFRIKEIPIIFKDRQIGQSKMSKKIVFESIFMVWKIKLTVK